MHARLLLWALQQLLLLLLRLLLHAQLRNAWHPCKSMSCVKGCRERLRCAVHHI